MRTFLLSDGETTTDVVTAQHDVFGQLAEAWCMTMLEVRDLFARGVDDIVAKVENELELMEVST